MISTRTFQNGLVIRVLTSVVLVGFVLAPACAQKLTLDESVKIALDNNPAVRIAREAMRKADATIRAAEAGGMPKLTLDGNYQRNDKVTTVDFGKDANGKSQTADLNTLNSSTADLTLTQFIDIFGEVKSGRTAAKYGRSAFAYGAYAQANQTTMDTKTAFFNVFRAQEVLKVQEETVAALEAHLKDTQANFNAGTVPQFEVLRAETQVANARQGLISAQNGVQLAKAAFNNVLGRPVDTPVDLVDPGKPVFVNLDQATAVDSAKKNRPEVLQSKMLIGANEKLTDIARLGSKPNVNLRWVYNENFDNSLFNSRPNSWTAFVTMSMPVFDGGAVKAATDSAASDTRTARDTLDLVTNGVTLDAKQSALSLNEARERINASGAALDQAKESMRLAQVRYKGGVSTQLEVLDAQTALTEAETNYVNALYDYQVDLAKLEHAVGGREQFSKLVGNENSKH